jgi:rRNA-processing protein FCF1
MEKSSKIKVLLDTNFLLTMIRYKIHALDEIKSQIPSSFFVLSGVLGEMNTLGKHDKKIKKEVAIAKEIINKNNVKIIQSTIENIDNELIQLSRDYVIATNDRELRIKVKKNGGKTIFVKKLTLVDVTEILD